MDRNKRSGAYLFLWFLARNEHLLAKPVQDIFNEQALTATTLLVAESRTEQRALITQLIENMIPLKFNKESQTR